MRTEEGLWQLGLLSLGYEAKESDKIVLNSLSFGSTLCLTRQGLALHFLP